ncbi:MAG: alpha/beta hydrolase [Candidatus Lokiarchaeota archaeon]
MDKLKLSNGIEIAYKISGDNKGSKMVLLHDLFVNSDIWKFQIPFFEKDFNILRFDLRGHGRSTKPEEGYTIRNYVDDLNEILSKLSWQNNIYLIGHSLGAMIGVIYSLENPSHVKRLVLIDSFCHFSQESVNNLLERIETYTLKEFCEIIIRRSLIPFNQNKANLIENLILNNMTGKNCLNAVRAYSGFQICGELQNLRIPTLIVVGEKDQITPTWASEMMHSWIPNSNLVVISEAGHQINLNHHKQLNNIIQSFWNEEMSKI